MSTPAAKRRRLDTASRALSQPFKSPFQTPRKTNNETPSQSQQTTSSAIRPSQDQLAPPKSPTQPTPTPATTTPTRSLALAQRSHVSPLTSSLLRDPHLNSLQKQHSALVSTLSTLRAELDTYIQALKIETSGKDAELEALIAKWKSASRAAAEEIFGGVKDRVNRMGGVGAWREREREAKKRFSAWDEEPAKRDEDEDSDDDKVGSKERRNEMESRREELEGMGDGDEREEGVKSAVEDGNDDDVGRH
ncbi:hypothetical protein LPUS_02138 [Lasallia pustulata]|uniref:Uncharacterized protein n=1 Tax=Lasallia pustulata TaxID=136370 RepID=A0A1W5CS02_9LECA|nr:hypothetical protein LPUS_02138 [Lasallia pustulata]